MNKGYSLLQIAGFHEAPNLSGGLVRPGATFIATAPTKGIRGSVGYADWIGDLGDKYRVSAGRDAATGRAWVDVAGDTLASSNSNDALAWINAMRNMVLVNDISDNSQARQSYLTDATVYLMASMQNQPIIGATSLPTPAALAQYVTPDLGVAVTRDPGMMPAFGPAAVVIGLIVAYFLFFKK